MKFIRNYRIAHLRSYCLILGIALIPVYQARSLDSVIAYSSDRDSRGVNRDIFLMKDNGAAVRNIAQHLE